MEAGSSADVLDVVGDVRACIVIGHRGEYDQSTRTTRWKRIPPLAWPWICPIMPHHREKAFRGIRVLD